MIILSIAVLAFLATATERSVPVYTNDDLARVAPFRDQTGVSSRPAHAPPPLAASSKAAAPDSRGEDYWRREAERVRDRLLPLVERAGDLRRKIAERQGTPGVLPYSDPRVRALQRDLAAVEQKARDLESRLEERARRAGALPGWLR